LFKENNMKRINRLLIDSSSVLMACLHAAKSHENCIMTEFDDKEEIVPSAVDGYEIFLTSLERTLKDLGKVPSDIILVKDGSGSRELRRKVLPKYKDRPTKNPVFLEQFNIMEKRAEEMLWSYGALSVVKDREKGMVAKDIQLTKNPFDFGYEADDLIAAIWGEGDSIWSKDGDLLAAGDWYYDRQTNPDKFFGIAKKHIVVYKSLVGDQSDKIPGAKGFGKVAFVDMIAKYGDDVCDDFLDMLKNETLEELKDFAEDFKPFQKILDDTTKVYQSYGCAKFYHPGWNLDWQARFPETNGDLPKWNSTVTLMGADSFDLEEVGALLKEIKTGYMGLDIETYEDDESLEWGMKNKASNDKDPKLDVFGSHMTGLSLTCGENNQHVYYFPVEHADTDNLDLSQLTAILNKIPDDVDVIVHNSGFELPIVRKHCELRHDRGWLPNVLDTKIEKSYVNENTLSGLKLCTKTYLQYDQTSYTDVTQGRRMNEIPGIEVLDYGADDAVVVCPLHSLFRAIMDYEGTSHAFDECEQWSAYMFAEAFLNGQRFDLKRLKELEAENLKEHAEIIEKVDGFLMDLEWTKKVKKLKNGTKEIIDANRKAIKEAEGKILRWPGCIYEPIEELSGPEMKRMYLICAGETLNTKMRAVPKIGALIEEKGYPELGKAICEKDLDKINEIVSAVWEPAPVLNMGSSKQKCNLLYEALEYKVRLHGKISDKMREEGRKQGNPKADEDAFKLALIKDAGSEDEKEFLKLILRGVSLQTEQSLYFNPYVDMPNPKDGMVHYGTGHSAATTRRNTPNGPNVGQVSKKSPIREIYDAYADDMIWISCDWSGQELRLTAFRSGCEVMRACYPWDGPALDIHSLTGVEVIALEGTVMTYDEFTAARKDKEHPLYEIASKGRGAAKAVNFGDIYGQQKQGLALKLMITEDAAEAIMDAKAKAFPGVAQWKKDIRLRHREDGFATTLLGARKHLQLDGSWKDEHEYRSAANFEIQSPAAEQMKLAASKMWVRKLFDRFDAIFHFPVHDEMNASSDGDLKFIEEFHSIMLEPYGGMDLPIESSIEIGANFGDLTEIGTVFDVDLIKEKVEEVLHGNS
jgi:DNA polymerase I-like protein with 3'-5' exonuclease and polymerase domains/5'-3' exonuclease